MQGISLSGQGAPGRLILLNISERKEELSGKSRYPRTNIKNKKEAL
ncbi:hypothetical protein HMPREF0080_00747 [Anaeroglobus geminatus F0357]|uniref:Uncharacterized protein n=1 Tax=Anaeroglobus geminatus F0357 TaxID=861450 RepID=G9YGI1_9FIRM|nr:hypothetical protein HMPREF0080_00747 [Anaeroglobus geminatus F0357]